LLFATASSDGSAQIWTAASGNPLHTLPGHGEAVTRIVFSPNGRLVATVSHSGLRLWDVASGNEVVLPFPIRDQEGIYNVTFSPDGKRLATVGRHISFWDTASGQKISDLSADSRSPYSSVVFSPNGERLATTLRYPDEVRLWDYSVPEKPRLLGTWTTTINWSSDFQGAVFSPDGSWLAFPAGLGAKTVRVLDVASGREGFSLYGQTGGVVTVAFSHDGKQIYAVADDGTLCTHPTRIEDLMTEARSRHTGLLSTKDCDTFHLQATEPCQAASLVDEARLQASRDHVEEALVDFQKAKQLDPLADLDPNVEVAKSLIYTGNQLAIKGNVPSSVATFQEAIKLDPSLKLLDLQTRANQLASRHFVQNGDNLAERGDMQGATAQFQQAIKLNPALKLPDLQTRASQLAARHFVQTGQGMASKGDVAGAAAQFEVATKLDPTLGLDPQTTAKQLAIQSWVSSGMELLRERKFTEAIGYFTKAQTLGSTLIDADSWNSLCYGGSVEGHAAEVMFACERALKLDPNNWHYLDSRGVARALTGNSKGAIRDLDAFIAQTQNQDEKAQRQSWVRILRKGQKLSFTEDEIKQLLTQ